MQRCVSRSAALDTEISGASAPMPTMFSWCCSSAARLPMVTAPYRRSVESAEHRNATRPRMGVALANFSVLSPMQPDNDRLHRVASTSCCNSGSSSFASASNGSSPPPITTSSRTCSSIVRPRSADTARSVASWSPLFIREIRGDSAPSSMIMRWFVGTAAKLAMP